jgi:hypothetical protein
MKKKIVFIIFMMLSIMFSFVAYGNIQDSSFLRLKIINQDPDPVTAGDIVEIRLGIENFGGETINNLKLLLEDSYPFKVLDFKEIDVGSVRGFQSGDNVKIIRFKLRLDESSPAGIHYFELKYLYDNNKEGSQKIAIDVRNTDNVEIIYIDVNSLIPGRETKMTFTIQNVGKSPLRDLWFMWENKDDAVLPVGSDNSRFIEYLDIGEKKEISYNVIANTNVNPGLYKINIQMTYNNHLGSNYEEKSSSAGIYIGGETDFEIALSDISTTGTSFSIANIGSNPAYSVSVRIPIQNGWTVSGSNSAIIGNLNNGDYTLVTFNLQRSNTRIQEQRNIEFDSINERDNNNQNISQRGGSINRTNTALADVSKILVEVHYTNTKGERIIITKDVIMSLGNTDMNSSSGMDMNAFRTRQTNVSQQSSFDKYKGYFITLAIIILGIIGYRYYKKKKLEERIKNSNND